MVSSSILHEIDQRFCQSMCISKDFGGVVIVMCSKARKFDLVFSIRYHNVEVEYLIDTLSYLLC